MRFSHCHPTSPSAPASAAPRRTGDERKVRGSRGLTWPGGAAAGVAGAGHVAVGGAAAGPTAPGRALGAAARRSGLDDRQPPAGAAAAEAQRVLGPRTRGPGLEATGRAGGQPGAPPAQVSESRRGRGAENGARRRRGRRGAAERDRDWERCGLI